VQGKGRAFGTNTKPVEKLEKVRRGVKWLIRRIPIARKKGTQRESRAEDEELRRSTTLS
jgi:hypothetical protein